MSVAPGPMSKTSQYMNGVIGAEESSTTSARLLVPGGAPDQLSGGLIFAPWQVYRWPRTPWINASLLIDIGATAEPEPAVPQPARVRTAAEAAPAARARGRRHLRRRIPSWPEVTEIFSFMPTVDIRACPARKRKVNRRVEWSGGRRESGRAHG